MAARLSAWWSTRLTAFGVVSALTGSTVFAAHTFLVKVLMLNGSYNTWSLLFTRMVTIGFFITPVCTFRKAPFFRSPRLQSQWKIVALRCLAGAGAIASNFQAINHLPVAEATVVITTCCPVFASFLSCIILKEKFRYWDILLFSLSISGVVLILKPPILFGEDEEEQTPFKDRLIGLVAAVCCSIFQAFAILSMRMLSSIDPSVLVWWFAVSTSAIFGIFSVSFGFIQIPQSYLQRLGGISCGVSAAIAQLLITTAAHHIPAPLVTLSRSVEVALLLIAQSLILGVVPHGFSLLGTCVVLFAMFLLITRAFLIDQLKKKKDTENSIFSLNSQYRTFFVRFTL